MKPVSRIDGPACPLPLANVDTDQILPARFMRRSRAEGYGDVAFHDLRFAADGRPDPGFPLNAPEAAGARLLVARRNFGCGSSREAAVYALVDLGLGAVIAPSFGDIFAQNAVNNGLVPARVEEADIEDLLSHLGAGGRLVLDLDAQTILAGNRLVPFAIDPVWRTKLLHGWDDLDLARAEGDRVAAFMAADADNRPWLIPSDR